jgi:hypothetical protein
LQGPISIHVFATPTMGRRKSSSEKPAALSIARDGARSGPSVITPLRGFMFSAMIHSWFWMNAKQLTMAQMDLQAVNSKQSPARL